MDSGLGDKMAKVSIIIPIYNVEPFLNKCLQSVANQTYGDFEAILVDDGSTDGCQEICNEWCERDHRFIYYYKENGGLGSARNYGIKKADGEWITFLDSDDWLESVYLEKMTSKIADDVDVVYCDAVIRMEKDVSKIANIRSIFNFINAGIEDRIALGINASVWAAMYKRSLWEKIGIDFPHIIYEDTAVYGVLVYYFCSYAVVEMPLYNYRKRVGSIMDLHKFKYYEMIVALQYLLRLAKDRNIFEKYKREYLELCRSQLTPRWRMARESDAGNIQREIIEFYRENFSIDDTSKKIASIGSHIAAKVYDGLVLFPDYQNDVYSFTSIISIMSKPIKNNLLLDYVGNNTYRIEMIKKDLGKLWKCNTQKYDYIIVDLLDERNDIITYKDSMLLYSEAIETQCKIKDNVEILDRYSNEGDAVWEESVDAFYSNIKKSDTKIILIELYLVEQYGSFKNRKSYNNLNEIRRINHRLASYYNYIKNKYNVISVKIDPQYCYTDETYKFGCFPWYYNDVAIYILRKKIREIVWSKM